MTSVKVLVANSPRLMRELVLATISNQPGLEIVSEIQDEAEIAEAVERTLPDFLIISLEGAEERPKICDTLLQRYPKMKIIALAPEHNRGVFYWTSFDIRSSGIESSKEGILNALRKRYTANSVMATRVN
jgi:chemotaxis response regulator CheB